jgi:PadR family transcriptional regulator, regulatory protein PadR
VRKDSPVPDASLGEFEQLVLLAVLRLNERAYGVTIQEEIRRRAERDVSLGAVYKTLERLEDKGYLASYLGDPTPERGGRRKKYYTVAPIATDALRQSLRALRRMTAGLPADLRT